jgi:uncharacterized protein
VRAPGETRSTDGGDAQAMVIETVVTTLGETGEPHFAAMGVLLGEETVVIRPYTNTRTFRYLQKHGDAVVNVTDDVLLFTKSALTHEQLDCERARHVRGVILRGACHWHEVQVAEILVPPATPGGQRADVVTRIVHAGTARPFAGFCRAKHAVVEASILASRLRPHPLAGILGEIDKLEPIVEKTGGPREREALRFIRSYIAERSASPPALA